MRVAVAETALAFDRQVEIVVPLAPRRDLAAGAADLQPEPARHVHRHLRAGRIDLRIEAVCPGLAVMVAPIGEKRDREMRLRSVAVAPNAPGKIGRVGARLHPDSVLDDPPVTGKAPNRDRPLEVKA